MLKIKKYDLFSGGTKYCSSMSLISAWENLHNYTLCLFIILLLHTCDSKILIMSQQRNSKDRFENNSNNELACSIYLNIFNHHNPQIRQMDKNIAQSLFVIYFFWHLLHLLTNYFNDKLSVCLLIFKYFIPAAATTVVTVTNSKPFSCDFEQNAICSFTQDTNDEFDWTWAAGKTGSSGTGPTNDHTYASPTGQFC